MQKLVQDSNIIWILYYRVLQQQCLLQQQCFESDVTDCEVILYANTDETVLILPCTEITVTILLLLLQQGTVHF